MSTSVNTSATASAKASQSADGGQAVQAAQALPAGQQPAAAPFRQWLGQQAEAAPAAAPAAAFAALTQAMQAAAPEQAPAAQQAGTPAVAADETTPAADGDDGAAQDNTLLAAMAMPLMPLTPMQIAQAVQIAQNGSASNAAAETAGETAGETGKAAPAGQAAVAGVNAAGQDGARRADAALAQLPLQTAPATQAARPDDGAVRFAVQAAAGHAGGSAAGNGNPAGADAGSAQDGNTAGTAPATSPAAGIAAAAAPAVSQPAAADTVKLAGPPTAWRQSLQEALGDRLQLQVGKNMEQAVIRLEPPQLGRIDIAIRHSNGTLEVNISASNGEVLRQLQAVGDNLRNDLAQRQYTDVAVSVTPTPKSSAASPFGDPQQQQQQGRGRQPGRDQEEPGRALAEASNATSAFSLGGRES